MLLQRVLSIVYTTPTWTCRMGQEASEIGGIFPSWVLLPSHQVKTKDESRSVGRISKQWGGLLREALTDADDFGLQFPVDLDVRVKAVLLGATFLIVSWPPASALPFLLLDALFSSWTLTRRSGACMVGCRSRAKLQ